MNKSKKNILELFKLDWQRIFNNKLTFVLIIALMIIPSLYAWFNIAALWDPYSNTKDIPIAVYTDDKSIEILDKKVNIGEKVVDSLKENDSIGWQFVHSKKELDQGVKSGKYFAGIYLPKDFSENLVSFLEGDIKKPEIQYSVNQKINAIAPKITDKGANSIKDTITNQFIGTTSKTLLEVLNELGYDIDEHMVSINKIASTVLKVDENLDTIDGYTKEVMDLNKKMPEFNQKLGKANEFIQYLPEVDKAGAKVVDINKMMPKIKDSGKIVVLLQDKIPEIQNAGKQIAMVDEDFDSIALTVNDAIVQANKGLTIIGDAQGVIRNVGPLAESANQLIGDTTVIVEELQQVIPELSSGITASLTIVSSLSQEIEKVSGELIVASNNGELTEAQKQGVINSLNQLVQRLETAQSIMDAASNTLIKIQEATGDMGLTHAIEKLTQAKDSAYNLQVKIADLSNQLEQLSSQQINQELQNIHDQAAQMNQFVNRVMQMDIEGITRRILTEFAQTLNEASHVTGAIIDKNLINRVDELLSSTSKTIQTATDFLSKYQKELPALHVEIHDANVMLNGNMDTIIHAINQSVGIYQNDLPTLEKKVNKASSFVENDWPGVKTDLVRTMDMVNEKMPHVEDALGTATVLIEKDWPTISSGIHKAAEAIRKGQNEVDLKEVVKLLKSDVQAESDFITSPIRLKEHAIYPVPNYGSASTPFYTALCLWVGSVLFSSIATTEFYLNEEQKKKYSSREQFVARMGTFLVVSFFQSLIVSLGNLFLLDVYTVNPFLSVIFSVVVGWCFMMIVYVLVAIFGNLGKGMAVILLVLSISGGGGNFPIQMSGKFFQIINPLLPFTHAVNLLREPTGGIYWPNTIKYLSVMIILFILFFVLGVALFPKIRGYFSKLSDRVHEGHILH